MKSISRTILEFINEGSNGISAGVSFDEHGNIKYTIASDGSCILGSTFYNIYDFRKELESKTDGKINIYVGSIDVDNNIMSYSIQVFMYKGDEMEECMNTYEIEKICREYGYSIFL